MSAGFWEVGSGEEFKLRYLLATFKYVFRKLWIWAGEILIIGRFCIRGKGLNPKGSKYHQVGLMDILEAPM